MPENDFDYKLPPELVATRPAATREQSRLLYFNQESGLQDLGFSDFPKLLQPNDAVVVNDTMVIPARLHLRKESGGKVELLLERILQHDTALVQLRASRRPRPGSKLLLNDEYIFQVKEYRDGFALVQTDGSGIRQILQDHGQVPLPPYIARAPDSEDTHRYQTIFARHEGSVAAPTAGLHFSKKITTQCEQAGATLIPVTLHVGAGTFQQLRPEQEQQGELHQEYFAISDTARRQIQQAKQNGGRIIAVGTTVTRALETAANCNRDEGTTTLFIKPGYKFKAIDALLTNFHLPKSSLLMLVCAFAGTDATMKAYHHAIKNNYRFYSYGDAMFIPLCSHC